MAVRRMQTAIDSGTSARPSGPSAAPSGADDLFSLTEDELTALMPSEVPSTKSLGRTEPSRALRAARPSPKQSGRFVTDGGRLVAPKIVKRSAKPDQAAPHKASGAYAKAVTAKPTTSHRGASTKLEDFSDLVAEFESLDPSEDAQTRLISHDLLGALSESAASVHTETVDVEASIADAVRAALPQLTTVPLSLATVAESLPESKPRSTAAASTSRPRDVLPIAPAQAPLAVASAVPTAAPELPAEPAPAAPAPAKRARSVFGTMLMVTALLGSVAAGAWVAGDIWAVRHRQVPAHEGQVATAAAPPPAAEEPPTVPEPKAAPVAVAEPVAPADVPTSAPSTVATVSSPPPAVTAKPAAARPTAAPSSGGAAEASSVEQAKEPRAASKPARRARAPKGSDDAKANGEASAEVDEETKKALEALQKSQLESSF